MNEPILNKYYHWYISICQKAQQRNWTKKIAPCYVEKHHIIPKSFYKQNSKTGWLDGNPNDPSNAVILTTKEHFICHLLLTKFYTNKAKNKMQYALWKFCTGMKKQKQVISSKQYENIKTNFIKMQSINFKNLWKNLPPEEKNRRLQLRLQHLDKIKDSGGLAAKLKLTGIPKTEEHKSHMRGKRPHVNQSGSNNNFARKCSTPYGIFGSVTNLHKHLLNIGMNIKYDTIHYKFRSHKPGWEYIRVSNGG